MISRIALLAALAAAAKAVASGVPLTNADAGAAAPAAQVRVAIVATGDVGQYAGMCDAAGGVDSLSGTLDLQGLNDDGSAMYAGKLRRATEVDACGTKPAPTEDQVVMCVAHLSGSAPMDVTLEVYEDDRGVGEVEARRPLAIRNRQKIDQRLPRAQRLALRLPQ